MDPADDWVKVSPQSEVFFQIVSVVTLTDQKQIISVLVYLTPKIMSSGGTILLFFVVYLCVSSSASDNFKTIGAVQFTLSELFSLYGLYN